MYFFTKPLASTRYNSGMLKKIAIFITSVTIPLTAGALGSLATIPAIPTWYAAIEKPPLLPPNGVFGPVWTVLYIAMGIALYLVWTAKSKQPKKRAYSAFGVQMALNLLWSIAFFGWHAPWLGLVIIIALIGAIAWAIYEFWQHSKTAAYLMVPYIAWVSFATYLTAGVAIVN